LRAVLAAFTVRGSSFLAAGFVGILTGLTLGSDGVISVGMLLVCLPALSVLAARRTRYQLRCERSLVPPRVAPGQAATVAIRLENVSRISTGLLLAEEAIPYPLGAKPRYVLNGIERGGSRELAYQVRSDMRGKYVIGPMRIQIADVFGLVELSANFASQNTLTVTPRVVPLYGAPSTGSWSNDGDGRSRMTAAAGEDDVIPRAYRDGDELRRVHWRSTARYGELMVRREEQRWQDRAIVILDTRRSAHAGTGPGSSFEYAVSAAASIGVHMAKSGLDGRLVTDAGPMAGSAMFEDVLLDSLAVVRMSSNYDFAHATAALGTIEGGMLILIAGRLSEQAARDLAATRRHGRQAVAILLATSTWAGQPGSDGQHSASHLHGDDDQDAQCATCAMLDQGDNAGEHVHEPTPAQEGLAQPGETAAADAILRAAGWRVVTADARTPLASAWQRLPRTSTVAFRRPQAVPR